MSCTFRHVVSLPGIEPNDPPTEGAATAAAFPEPSAEERAYTQACLAKPRPRPPLSPFDTQFWKGGVALSKHGDGSYAFENQEIVSIYPPDFTQPPPPPEMASYAHTTRWGHVVVQQRSQRGCTAAALNMLLLDHKRKPNILALQTWNGRRVELISMILRQAGLNVLESQTAAKSLSILEELLSKYGPAIVSIDTPSTQGHVIVVDALFNTGALIREPYHGWNMLITRQALQNALDSAPIIQVQQQ